MLQQLEFSYAQNGEAQTQQPMNPVDPVWGPLELPEGQQPSPCTILCFAFCPCCTGQVPSSLPLYHNHSPFVEQVFQRQDGRRTCQCAESKRAGCALFTYSVSFSLAIIQVLRLVFTLSAMNHPSDLHLHHLLGTQRRLRAHFSKCPWTHLQQD